MRIEPAAIKCKSNQHQVGVHHQNNHQTQNSNQNVWPTLKVTWLCRKKHRGGPNLWPLKPWEISHQLMEWDTHFERIEKWCGSFSKFPMFECWTWYNRCVLGYTMDTSHDLSTTKYGDITGTWMGSKWHSSLLPSWCRDLPRSPAPVRCKCPWKGSESDLTGLRIQ